MALALIFLYFGLEFSIMSGENGHSRPLLNAPLGNVVVAQLSVIIIVAIALLSPSPAVVVVVVGVVKLFSFDATIARARFSTAD